MKFCILVAVLICTVDVFCAPPQCSSGCRTVRIGGVSYALDQDGEYFDNGAFLYFSVHAIQRMHDRGVTWQEIRDTYRSAQNAGPRNDNTQFAYTATDPGPDRSDRRIFAMLQYDRDHLRSLGPGRQVNGRLIRLVVSNRSRVLTVMVNPIRASLDSYGLPDRFRTRINVEDVPDGAFVNNNFIGARYGTETFYIDVGQSLVAW